MKYTKPWNRHCPGGDMLNSWWKGTGRTSFIMIIVVHCTDYIIHRVSTKEAYFPIDIFRWYQCIQVCITNKYIQLTSLHEVHGCRFNEICCWLVAARRNVSKLTGYIPFSFCDLIKGNRIKMLVMGTRGCILISYLLWVLELIHSVDLKLEI